MCKLNDVMLGGADELSSLIKSAAIDNNRLGSTT
jgi:hypothetical protein